MLLVSRQTKVRRRAKPRFRKALFRVVECLRQVAADKINQIKEYYLQLSVSLGGIHPFIWSSGRRSQSLKRASICSIGTNYTQNIKLIVTLHLLSSFHVYTIIIIRKAVWSPKAIICWGSSVKYMHLCFFECTPYSYQSSTQHLPSLII